MTDKQKYWITSPAGVFAQVEGTEQRDMWTKVRGWSDAEEPAGNDRLYLVHTAAGFGGPIPFEALADGWADMGWSPGPPPMPLDITKDPTLVDQRLVADPAEGVAKPQIKAAAGGKSEEK